MLVQSDLPQICNAIQSGFSGGATNLPPPHSILLISSLFLPGCGSAAPATTCIAFPTQCVDACSPTSHSVVFIWLLLGLHHLGTS